MVLTEDYKRELVLIFFSQVRVILGITALIFIGAVLVAFLWPPTYSATGIILIKGKKVERGIDDLQQNTLHQSSYPVGKEDLASEAQFLSSPVVIERTIRSLHDRGILFQDVSMAPGVVGDIVDRAAQSLKVKLVPASDVLAVTYYAKDPRTPVAFLDALMEQYILYRQQIYKPSETEVFFAGQVDKYKKELRDRENELMLLVEQNNAADPEKEIDKNLLIQQDLEKELNVLKSQAIAKEVEINELTGALGGRNYQFFSFINLKSLNELSLKLIELTVERGKLVRSYLPLSPKVKAIDKQIAGLYGSLKGEVESYLSSQASHLKALNEQVVSLENRVGEIQSRNVDMKRYLLGMNRINRDIEFLQFSYDNFYRRMEEAKINNSIVDTSLSSFASIISRPSFSDTPVFPRKGLVIPFGLLAGFITGCCFGFLRDYFDHTFKKPNDIVRIVEVPALFSIPDWSNG
ncbi:MAG: GumC family protein [Desulfobacterales bacterium]|nr:GumC family protein [Desulfobacterales bacterium]